MKLKKGVKKGLKKSFKIAIIVIVILVLVAIGYLAYKRFFSGKTNNKQTVIEEKIDDYGYVLEEDAPAQYKTLFKELMTALNKDEIDEEAYARLEAQLL